MFCKKCYEDISPDCMLTNNICVFCHYGIAEWESNGEVVSKKDATVNYKNFFVSYVKHFKIRLNEAKSLLKTIPKGALVKKKIKGHDYYYLVYRYGKKIKFDYHGKKKPVKLLKNIRKGKELRFKLRERILEIGRILYILREVKRPSTFYNRYSILERDKFTCQYCGRKSPDVALEIDHIIPVSKGGSDYPSNLITACFDCNNQKRNKLANKEK